MGVSLSDAAKRAAAAVNQERLMAMSEIGGREDGGVNRQALSVEDRKARALLIGWAEARGFSVFVDPGANLYIRREGANSDLPAILTGSHMDSQPKGGRFDGIGGVQAGFEVLEALEDAGVETERAVEMIAFTNEEGGRFSPGCTGSMVWSGTKDPAVFDDLTDAEGIRYADALNDTLVATPDTQRVGLRSSPAAFIELHIEQGPVLEKTGTDIAAVTGIQGVQWYDVDIYGETAHAGATPLALRADCVQAMHRAISALNVHFADPEDITRFTVGRIEVSPNSPNAVADHVRFTIDFRHPDKSMLETKGSQLARIVGDAVYPCTATVAPNLASEPATFAEPLIASIEAASRDLGFGVMRLPSGAFHDALFVSRVCPTSMIFVPCKNGLSHHPDEYASPNQMATGTRVLAAVVADLANRNSL